MQENSQTDDSVESEKSEKPADAQSATNSMQKRQIPFNEMPPATLEETILMQASGTDSEGQSE
jgi:hypothetical protein